jgi:hypothetical protein
VLVAGAGCPAAAAAGADEAKYGMVVRKRRNARGPAATRAAPNGARRDEAPSPTPNSRELTPLNQPPDGRTRGTECPPRLLNGDHCSSHVRIVSRLSHRRNRLTRRVDDRGDLAVPRPKSLRTPGCIPRHHRCARQRHRILVRAVVLHFERQCPAIEPPLAAIARA